MEQRIIEEMKDFAIRVLKGGECITSQETAILPEILKMLAKFSQHKN